MRIRIDSLSVAAASVVEMKYVGRKGMGKWLAGDRRRDTTTATAAAALDACYDRRAHQFFFLRFLNLGA